MFSVRKPLHDYSAAIAYAFVAVNGCIYMWTDPRTAESVAQDRVELTGAILSALGWAEFTKPIDRDRCTFCVGTSYDLRGSLEFIRRFLQHVLPTGFMKVRYYGLLSPTAKVTLEELKAKVEVAHGFTVTVPEIELPPWPQPTCQACGGPLRFHSSRRIRRRPLMPTNVGPPGSTRSPAHV